MDFAELEVVVNGRPAKQEIASIGKGLDDLGNKADRTGDRAVGAFDKMKRSLFSLKNLLVSLGAITLFTTLIRTNADFEQSLANVQATLFATTAEMLRLEGVARKMGRETRFSATQAADAMGYLAQGGMSVKQIVDAMPGTLSLAASGNLQLAEAAEIATNTLNAFGLEAEKVNAVANVLALGSARTNASVQGLGTAAARAGQSLAPLGIQFEEVAAAAGALMNTGMDASQAGTKLASSLLFLASPSEDAKRAIRDLGLTLEDLSPQLNNIIGIITKLRGANADPRALERIFGKENFGSILTLMTSQFDTLVKLEDQFGKVADEADRMAKIRMDTLKGSLEELSGAIEEVYLKVGRDGGVASAFRDLVDLATEGIEWIVGNFHELRVAGVWVFGEMQKAFSYMVEFFKLGLEDFKLASGLVFNGLEHAFKGMAEVVKSIWNALMQALLLGFEFVLKGIIYSIEQLSKIPGPQQEYLKTALEGNKAALSFVTQQNAELSKQGDIFDRLAKNNESHANTAKTLFQAWQKATTLISVTENGIRKDINKGVGEIMTDFFLGRFGRPDIGRGIDPDLRKENPTKTAATPPPVSKPDMFDRFNVVGDQFSKLAAQRRTLIDEMNSEEWLSQATVDDVKEKAAQIQAVTDELVRQLKSGTASFRDSLYHGMQQTVEAWGTMSERAAQAGGDIVTSLDNNMTQGLTDIIMTTESVGEAFSKMATSIVNDLVRIMIQQFIVKQILQSLFGGFGSFGGGMPSGAVGGDVSGAGFAGMSHIGSVVGSGRPASFHTGGVTDDSVMVRARRGEGIFTEDQMQALGMAMAGGGKGGAKEVSIVNVTDPNDTPRAIKENPQAILNIITNNRRTIKAILDS